MDLYSPPSYKGTSNVEDSFTEEYTFSVNSPASPLRHSSPSLHISTSTLTGTSPISPITPLAQPQKFKKNNDRARTESRKLLAHVLSQLDQRELPPSIFDGHNNTEDQKPDNNLDALFEAVKDTVKRQRKGFRQQQQPGVTEDDSDDDGEHEFSTDETYNLVIQLKDVLTMSVDQGWHIFDENFERQSDGKPAVYPFRLPRNSLQPASHRSRSLSPIDSKRVDAPHLLSSCISALASVVLEDCRYRIASPRPSRPPNALQSLVLDVASFLLHLNRQFPNITTHIGFAILPAFSTFPPEMHSRLLAFFENSVIRGTLEDLERSQGINNIALGTEGFDKPLPSSGSSSVAIHIDTVDEDPASTSDQPHWVKWSSTPDTALRLRSTHAPFQSLSLYSLSSIVAPLLATILESVDLELQEGVRTNVLHRFCRLLHLIVDKKVDAYNDILQIIGYHTSKARHKALSILCKIWPAAVGHIVISEPFDDSYLLEGPASLAQTTQHPHQFMPWRFPLPQDHPRLHGFSQHDCRSCSRPIHGFGLLCLLCMCGIHFDCYDYPEGSCLLQYPLASDPHVRRVAMYRFSSFQSEQSSLDSASVRSHTPHTFRLVNLFTLCLCFICKEPLWGCAQQGLQCASCSHFTHSSCLHTTSTSEFPCSSKDFNSDHVSIDWRILRQSCVDFHHDIIQLSYNELALQSFEEISIIHATLWIQLQILTSGIAMSSIMVKQQGKNVLQAKNHDVGEFELHHVVRWCEDLLSSDKLPRSDTIDNYMEENHLTCSEYLMMFDWANLVYVASVLKSPYPEQHLSHSSSSDLLSVTQPSHFGRSASDGPSQPFEFVPLSHMRDMLGYTLNIYSDNVAKLLLSHLHRYGLFCRIDGVPILFNGDYVTNTYCSFPIPFGLDLSSTVEILVSAIEACLSDAHLSNNEVGLLLLVRRFWPNGMASEYALRRLTRSTLSWILAEDDHLTTVLHDYLEKKRSLPGVRSNQDPAIWPLNQSSRPTQSSSTHNGGDYLATRRALLSQYIMPWLLALHDLDAIAYAALVYEGCLEAEVASFSVEQSNVVKSSSNKEGLLNHCDRVLRSIARLAHLSVAYSVFDELFLHWLESVIIHDLYDKPMPSLHRLFPRDSDLSAPYSGEQAKVVLDGISIDPWRVIVRNSSEEFLRSLKWLYMFAYSGIEIPLTIFKTVSDLGYQYQSPLSDCLLFAKAILCSTWLRSRSRQEIQTLLSELHVRLSPQISANLNQGNRIEEVASFIRISLATCSLLYGCDRNKIIELGLIEHEDIKGLPPRRKLNSRGSAVVDPMIVNPRLMEVLEKYIAANIAEITCVVVKFLYLFLTDSPYLESYEVDNFILRNGRLLAICAWQSYDAQDSDISSLRAHFLLRTLVVDSEPFRDVLETWFLPTSSWERRLLAVTRLFRVVLDVINPSFHIEDRQWKSSVSDIFYYFFTSLWSDKREEIRLATDSLSASLLPAHFEAISACWNELLPKMSIVERIRLITFLIQLHPHFPRWQVISWDALFEALLDDAFNEQESIATRLSIYGLSTQSDPDVASLRVSTVYLSLQMIADGITIDGLMLLKLKKHLLQASGFRDVSIASQNGQLHQVRFGEITEIPVIAHPCINQLLVVMDAPYPVDIAPAAMAGADELDERPVSVLVGSIFVDMFLSMFCAVRDLASLPVLTFKNMLETLCVINYKHDFESRTLRHLQQALRRAVARTLEFLTVDMSYDLRQLALSVTQAFVKRWHSFMGSLIYTAIESVVKLIASQHQHGQDALVLQAKAFLDATLCKYSQNGLFANLVKRPLQQEFFAVLKQVTEANAKKNPEISPSLREALLRDVFTRTMESDSPSFQNVLNNLQFYVEVTFHEGYSVELLQFVGQQLTYFARRCSELPPDNISPVPLLGICATLIHYNKPRSREMLLYIDTVMRVVLTRLNVSCDCLTRLLQVTNSVHRKLPGNDPTSIAGNVLMLIFELLGDGLRMKTRVLPFTLKSMLEAITTTEATWSLSPIVGNISLLGLVDPGIHFLQNHIWQDVDKDFAASLAVARMLLQVSGQDPTVMVKLASYGSEKTTTTNFRVRAWSILVVAALLEPKEHWYNSIFAQIQSFSFAHHGAIRAYIHGASSSEPSTAEVNHAYIAIKLWILMAHRVTSSSDFFNDSQSHNVWNELWPPFEALISQLEVDPRGQYLNLGTLVLSSVADLFVFLRTLHSPLALQTSTYVAILNRLANLGAGETLNQKVSRASRYMSEPPPEASFETLVNQAAKDIVAAEKLRMVETRVVQERRAPEKRGRDLRATT